MRFTRLRLNGFKSFVDPTDLVIHDGLTGIVGPNGCGKSNLLEALRWVMGENRPTAMRGGGMEDVIFAGAATRPARNYAEVSLHIDNSERLAPAAFNDADELDIVRRITRDAGSAYKVGTKDVRARDVQMLFADASTGSHSPALVRQGQISELINARPQNRRRILEEAAGISGLYARRHEAELKLKGAEANLARVDDVIEQLAAQLASLARQARTAARYREIGERLRRAEGLLLYRRWSDAEAARVSAFAALRERAAASVAAERDAAAATEAREGAEAALPPLREEDGVAAAILQRLQVQRDTAEAEAGRARGAISALTGRLAQIDKDMERETALNADAGETIARLRAEASALEAAGQGHPQALAAAEEGAREAAEVLAARESDLSAQTEEVARLAARHQSARRQVEDGRRTLDKAGREAERARAALAEATAKVGSAGTDLAAAEAAEAQAAATARNADSTLAAAEAARAETQGEEAEARAARSEAEGEATALRAEVAALARLVDRDRVEGGSVMDLLSVESGYETALGAALADDLRAPLAGPGAATGWAALPPYDAAQPLPAGARPLAEVVQVPDVLARRIAQVGLVAAAEGPRLQAALRPGQRLVSAEGDLWRWDGFRAGAADAPSAAALRLRQVNRLTAMRRDLDAAEAAADAARAAHEALAGRLSALTEADAQARAARRDADRLVAEANRRLARAEADRDLAAGRRESAALAVTRHEEEAAEAARALAAAEAGAEKLGDLEAARGVAADLKTTVEAARITMMSRRSALDETRREGEARARRAAEVARELATWTGRLDTASKRADELSQRRDQTESQLAEARRRPDEIAARQAETAKAIAEAESRRAGAAEALEAAEAALRGAALHERDAERAASDSREARAGAEARAEAARETVAAAEARIAEALETTPAALADTLGGTEGLPPADAIEGEVAALRRQRDGLGAVNLRAEEDAREVQAEHDTLVTEKADLEAAIATLRSGIASLNKEGRERLLTAFDEVNGNFSTLFTHLFGGGEAKLTLVESDDPLEAGLEILCQPPGKKLSTLSLLSGGEQTLTALALIFAVFLANPAPICVLDEVDAPLDDANVTRFCDLLDEMTRRTRTRFLIITHHAVTMSRMDRLFGVTMGEQGVSQLVSVDLRKAEALVA
ncbi:chromosome segregation protein SMC [Wenxinia saemankumensis]|uniref:Chromosome partition protein Smc n=1 Tax=Wenxinia saemankumensis TaxID=1447782 RepID=A0A1M6E429_9RHOB|nr:chromosome segregation protein SMC [Wenxinia saemankumensis]SHI80252.1 condensin subunit Smc [Wenxinia saemankumensis]